MLRKYLILYLCIVSSDSISGESNKLAYLSYTGDYWQAFIQEANDQPARKVTDTDFDISAISWTDDGERLFICGLQGETGLVDINSGDYTAIRLPHKNTNDAVMSSDGNKIIYSVKPNGGNNKLYYYDLKKKLSSPIFTRLKGRQYDPKWSKDGKSVFFISGESDLHYEIIKGDLITDSSNVVVNNAYNNFDVDVTDNKIVYSSNVNGAYNIWLHSNGSNILLTNETNTNAHPSISGDGNQVYYERVDDGNTSIWALDISSRPDLSTAKQISSNSNPARYPVVYKGAK